MSRFSSQMRITKQFSKANIESSTKDLVHAAQESLKRLKHIVYRNKHGSPTKFELRAAF